MAKKTTSPENEKIENGVNLDQLYYQALLIALKKFIDDDKQGLWYPGNEARLIKSIQAARELYK